METVTDTPWNNKGYRSRYLLRLLRYPIAAHAASSWPWFEYDSGLGLDIVSMPACYCPAKLLTPAILWFGGGDACVGYAVTWDPFGYAWI